MPDRQITSHPIVDINGFLIAPQGEPNADGLHDEYVVFKRYPSADEGNFVTACMIDFRKVTEKALLVVLEERLNEMYGDRKMKERTPGAGMALLAMRQVMRGFRDLGTPGKEQLPPDPLPSVMFGDPAT